MSSENGRKYGMAVRAGEAIARLRVEKGWTQRELARASRFSFQQINKVESGQINTPIETLARVASALGVDLEALFATAKQETIEIHGTLILVKRPPSAPATSPSSDSEQSCLRHPVVHIPRWRPALAFPVLLEPFSLAYAL